MVGQAFLNGRVPEVFEAFVDPAVTTQVWFTKSSGRLAPGREVRWDGEMYGAHALVTVKEFEPDKRILIEWAGMGGPNWVEWSFTPRAGGATLVAIANGGFHGTDNEQIAQAIDSTGGFAYILAGLKALLEHHLPLNLVPDHHPDAHQPPGA